MVGSHVSNPLALAQASGVDHHARGPSIDVLFPNLLAHQVHALPLLRLRHAKCHVERLGHLSGIERIDDQRFRKFTRGAGKAGKYQDAGIVIARCNKSLATKFIPSCRLLTMHRSAARKSSKTSWGSWWRMISLIG